jgi:hypothetical protein
VQSDEILKAEFEKTLAECERLRKENAQLRSHLGKAPDKLDSGTERSSAYNNNKPQLSPTVTANSPSELKVSLFRSLFRGRDDVYAVRWEGRGGRTGYSPAGVREWEQAPSVGRRQKRSFHLSKLFPLTDEVIRDHLLAGC